MRREKHVIIAIAETKSKEHQIPFELVLAVIEKESAFNNMTYRYEELWRYHKNIEFFATKTRVSYNSEKHLQATSWGLMQVMGTVARELGFEGHFTELSDPGVGIEFGCRKLKQLLKKYSTQDDAISSYNAGSPRRLPDGTYSNQEYVSKVNKFMLAWREQIRGDLQ